jgi:hypothetical protein
VLAAGGKKPKQLTKAERKAAQIRRWKALRAKKKAKKAAARARREARNALQHSNPQQSRNCVSLGSSSTCDGMETSLRVKTG